MKLLLTFKTVDGATFKQTTTDFPSTEAAAEAMDEAIRTATTFSLVTPADGRHVLATRHIVSIAIEAATGR
ncbi:hypothetical protein GCM10017673_40500 [Streptosporangium violaceochromogenes]|nr:hypothetical protein GCM10017673_40500 [Streptosporangium violaceochromogenes]